MATDFFERQDAARRNTTRLVLLFALAVVAIIASVDLLVAVTLGGVLGQSGSGGFRVGLLLDPGILALAVGGTLLVVAGGSVYKVAALAGGGRVVAEQLGGRRLTPNSETPAERQLLNVVEEMSIASGTPVPAVYLMDQESGINAFAAGFTPDDAVIGVTRGTAERLSRDELQGVIAHEFSHILNGDMRLNIRLIGLLHGILVIGLIGHFLLRVAAYSGRPRRRDQKGNPLPLLALGAGLMAIGFFGSLFGSLIKASVSRQREFLADASAVQFTRNPSGIAGALKKIGGLSRGSVIVSPNAPEASHLFFGRAAGGLTSLFSTHPPLAERIRRLEPDWDGQFVESASLFGETETPPASVGATERFTQTAAMVTPLVEAVDGIGQPTQAHLAYAAALIDTLPPPLVTAAREPHGARAVVYAMLLDRHTAYRERQLAYLDGAVTAGEAADTRRLLPIVDRLDVKSRLPLLEIAMPALGSLAPSLYQQFARHVVALVQADEQIDLFEWALQRILLHDLSHQYADPVPPSIRHTTLNGLGPSCEALLSTLAHVGHHDPDVAARAFRAGWDQLALPAGQLRPLETSGLDRLDQALTQLERAAPAVKRRVLQAAAACIGADLTITVYEIELLRAIAAALGCPMPPALRHVTPAVLPI